MDDDLIGSRGPGDPDASEYPDRDPGDEQPELHFIDF